MKKKVITTLLTVTIVGALLTGCGNEVSTNKSDMAYAAANSNVQSTEQVMVKEAEEETITEQVMVKEAEEETFTEQVEVKEGEKEAFSEQVEVKEAEKEAQTEQVAEKEGEEETPEENPYFGETGNIDNLKIQIGNSALYSEEELREATGYILGMFQVQFTDCVMTELTYDEAFSLQESEIWANQYGADCAIVFKSTFETTENYAQFDMEPGTVYSEYQWILTRNEGEGWTLQTWGY